MRENQLQINNDLNKQEVGVIFCHIADNWEWL